MDRKIILFELNEVPFRIVDEFRRWHPESALARRLPECFQYETYCENIGHLSPWGTWPTLHRGVANDKHFIADFGQDLSEQDEQYPTLWSILARHGVKTGVFGSLHTYPLPKDLNGYSFFVPDTFAAGSECFPNSMDVFQSFNLQMARESARNVSTKLPWQHVLQFLRQAPELGLRFRTFLDIGRQLVDERAKSVRKNRRRTYQAVLSFDIFMKQLEQTKPGFATFFTNHVASAQHRYWAAAFPGDYETFGFDGKWVSNFSREIAFAMTRFDSFFGRLTAFCDANKEYQLWVATSMGQHATIAKPLETQLYLVDPAKFTAQLGLSASEWTLRPAMLPQWNVVVAPHRVEDFRTALQSLTIYGSPLHFRVMDGGFFSVDFGHENMHEQPQWASLQGRSVSFEELGLRSVEIEDRSNASAYHIPEGTLIIYDPRNRRRRTAARTQVGVTELAPTLLKNFNVPRPGHLSAAVSLGT